MIGILIIGGILYFLFYADSGLSTQNVLNKATYSYEGFTVPNGQWLNFISGQSTGTLTAGVTNNTSQSITVQSFTGNVFVNDQSVSNISTVFPDGYIPPNDKTDFDIPISIDPSAIIQAAGNILTTQKIPPINIKGSLKSNGFTWPVNETIQLG